MDESIKVFVIYIAFFTLEITIHLIRKAEMILFLAKKVIVPAKYLDFADVFLKKSSEMLLEQTGVNEHAIKLEKDKEPLYKPIYSLKAIRFKNFKIYIKTNLANGFIKALFY